MKPSTRYVLQLAFTSFAQEVAALGNPKTRYRIQNFQLPCKSVIFISQYVDLKVMVLAQLEWFLACRDSVVKQTNTQNETSVCVCEVPMVSCAAELRSPQNNKPVLIGNKFSCC
jgi:hypothetical protein